MGVDRRCRELQRRFGVRIGCTTLRTYYKEAKIKYRLPVRSLDTSHSPDALRQMRIDFLQQLLRHIQSGQQIWWVDQTSTNLWERLHRVWMNPGRLLIRKSSGHRENQSIMGALSQHGGKLFGKLIPTTNAVEVEQFFREMAALHNMVGAIVILDQHRAHHALRVKELFRELQC